MSLWTRLTNALSANRLNRELNEEYESHIAEAIAQGRDPEEARRSFGQLLRHREQSRQHRVSGWLESLRIDLIFGLRQLKRNRITSTAAILSLGLAMGSCVGAFRLIDALLWRPLPIAHPERLYALGHNGTGFDGKYAEMNDWSYRDFAQMRDAVHDQADLLAVSYADRAEVAYGSSAEGEKASVLYVSAPLFRIFGLKPAAGRLFLDAEDDPNRPAQNVVLSYDYWTSRFGRDPKAVGSNIRIGGALYQIIGVTERSFTGTDPGTVTEIFLPLAVHESVRETANSLLRVLVVLHPGTAPGPLTRKLETLHRAYESRLMSNFFGLQKQWTEQRIKQQVVLTPASSGVSALQTEYQKAMIALGLLVLLVLLIACVNVANLMTAQAAARTHEMALRVSIGAGRLRLVQLVLTESILLAIASSLVGAAFACWSAPFVVSRISSPENPVRLTLPADYRVTLFALALTILVTLLFGLLPALRASSIRPIGALKSSTATQSRKHLMHGMIALQVAFCALVVFFASLFITTFQRLAAKPLGFNPDNLVLLESSSADRQPDAIWQQAAASLREIPGVEQTSVMNMPLLNGGSWISYVSTQGTKSPIIGYFCGISPNWLDTMRIPLLEGRDLRSSDTNTNVAIVNQAFARTYFPGLDPVGREFSRDDSPVQVIGLIHDSVYLNLRDNPPPTAYIALSAPGHSGKDARYSRANLVVRLKPDALTEALKPVLRAAITKAHAGLRVTNLRTQQELLESQTIRERLLAMLAFFFASTALLLAGIGLFGVLNYTVLQRRREIGIRMAVGARRPRIATLVARPIFSMIAIGAVAGLTTGILAARPIQTLLYSVKATDPGMLTVPAALILSVAILAVIPAIRRAIQTDPAEILRSE